MSGSLKNNTLLEIYKDKRTVFTLPDIAMLVDETGYNSLVQRLFYYVECGELLRPRKGIYAKTDYNHLELACLLYTPCYISLEYVLQKSGIIFQYNSQITMMSYLSRTVEIEDKTYCYRKIKNEILLNTKGIQRIDNVNIASPERALLDMLYLKGDSYFDNLNSINREQVGELLPIYQSKVMEQRIKNLFQ
ncbi:MAG: hypothetical protein ACK5IQ_08570 [Bacteroidales bacterium]